MPVNLKYLADFTAGSVYHVYNRTNNKELLFLNSDNRKFFLAKFEEYMAGFIELFAWNLLSNHFHLMIRIKNSKDIVEYLSQQKPKALTPSEQKFLTGNQDLGILIERTFKRFFQSYALAFNKYYKRKGNLFYRPFKRCLVQSDEQFTHTLFYIHTNAVRHGLFTNLSDHPWCSWHWLMSNEKTWLSKKEILEWFGGKANMLKMHLHHAKYFPEPDENMDIF